MSAKASHDLDLVVKGALFLGLGYVFIQYVLPALKTIGSGVSTAANAVTQGAANEWLNITNPSVLQPESQTMGIPGSVTFPNGAAVPFANIQNQSGVWSATDSAGNFYFTYQGGTVYQLTGQSVTGYQAVPSSFATLSQANAA